MKRSRSWYVQLVFGFFAMLASMGLVDHYITPAVAATVESESKPEATSGAKAAMPTYWIGVRCHAPIPPVLRAHLDIPEGQGLVVIDVVEAGPGRKAGVKPNDILINVGDTPLRSVEDLVEVVEATGGKPLEIGLLRAGKPTSLTVQPEKRPETMNAPSLPSVPASPDMERIQKWFEQNQPGQGNRLPMRLRFIHPGMVLPPDVSLHPGLPGGMSIVISRSGKDLAKITVKRYDAKEEKEQTWEVTEKELDKLPSDVRPHVERMLNGVIMDAMPHFDFLPSLDPNQPAPDATTPPTPEAQHQQWQEEFRQMQEQMNRMQKMMDQMKQRMEPGDKP